MAIVEPLSPTAEGRRRLGIRSPATREPVGEIVVNSQADVEGAIAKARDAQLEWARVPVAERLASSVARSMCWSRSAKRS